MLAKEEGGRQEVGNVSARAESPEVRAARLAERAETFDETLLSFRAELDVDRFASAMGKFREALTLSRAWEELRTRVVRAAAEESKKLLPRNWRVAEAVLKETQGLQSEYLVPSELWDRIRAAKHDETISNALYTVDRTELVNSVSDAKKKVEQLLVSYPGDARLLERLAKLEEQLSPKIDKTEAPKAEATQVEIAKVEPPPPTNVPLEKHEEAAAAPVNSRLQQIKVFVSSEAWEKVKTTMTVVAAASMVGAAAFLLWMHFTHPKPSRMPVVRAAKKADTVLSQGTNQASLGAKPVREEAVPATFKPLPADEKDWLAIRSSQRPEDMELFLQTHPLSPHAYRARVKLSALQWERVDKKNPEALRAYLAESPDSLHAKAAQDQLDALEKKR